MKDFFRELFEYGHHYNQKVAQLLVLNETKVTEKATRLYSHILNAHQIWNARVNEIPPGCGVWDIRPTQEFLGIDLKNHQDTLLLLEKGDLNKIIKYSTSKGDPFSNSTRDILFHVINHSTHHRAQISTEFRQAGIEPIAMDYIFYKR